MSATPQNLDTKKTAETNVQGPAANLTPPNSTSNPATFRLINIPNEEIIKRYRDAQEARKKRADKEQSKTKDDKNNDERLRTDKVENLLHTKPGQYPELKKFVEDWKKTQALTDRSKELTESTQSNNASQTNPNGEQEFEDPDSKAGSEARQLGLLERVLFHGTAVQNVELIVELTTLVREEGIAVDFNCKPTDTLTGHALVPIADEVGCDISHTSPVSALVYTLVNYSINAPSILWTELESLKRAQIVSKLIEAGATIDDSAFSEDDNIPFLHLFILRSIQYPAVREILLPILRSAKDFGLNFNILDQRHRTPLYLLILVLNRGTELMTGQEMQPFKEIIEALIQNNPLNYSIQGPGGATVFDVMIHSTTNDDAPVLTENIKKLQAEIHNVIFDNMADQCLERLTNDQYLSYRIAKNAIQKDALGNYAADSLHYADYANERFTNMGGYSGSIDRRPLAIEDIIVARAMRIFHNQCALGFNFGNFGFEQHLSTDQHLSNDLHKHSSIDFNAGTTIKYHTQSLKSDTQPIWWIVISYWLEYPFFVYYANTLGSHLGKSIREVRDAFVSVKRANKANEPCSFSEFEHSVMDSIQVVPLSFCEVTTLIEKDPNYYPSITSSMPLNKRLGPDNINGTNPISINPITYAFQPYTPVITPNANVCATAISEIQNESAARTFTKNKTDVKSVQDVAANNATPMKTYQYLLFTSASGNNTDCSQLIVEPSALQPDNMTIIYHVKNDVPQSNRLILYKYAHQSIAPYQLELYSKIQDFADDLDKDKGTRSGKLLKSFEKLAEELCKAKKTLSAAPVASVYAPIDAAAAIASAAALPPSK